MNAVIENEVDIEQPPEAVFDYVSDHTHELEWNIQMQGVRKLTEGPVGAGTRYEMEFIPGKPMVATCERFDRPRSWKVVGQALGMDVTLGGRVSQIPRGSHLVFRTECRSQGIRSLVLPLIRRRMATQMQHHVERIKSIPRPRPPDGSRSFQGWSRC
jgi:uncharacterized protein YndB with AHSA1/START domain